MNDLCRSLHVPSDSSGALVLFRGQCAYQNVPEPALREGLLREEEKEERRKEGSRTVPIARATDLSSTAVRFIHRGPSGSRLRSRRPPFIFFFPFSPARLRCHFARGGFRASLSEEVTVFSTGSISALSAGSISIRRRRLYNLLITAGKL